jgi:anti-sigma B factor antagonist
LSGRARIGYTVPMHDELMDFHVATAELEGGVACAKVVGEADLHTAPELKDVLGALVADGARLVLVDLSLATFLDSTTLGVLMGVMKKLRAQGGQIAIVCSDPNIVRIFEITLLDRVFAIFDTVEEGTSYLRQ